MQQRQRLDFIPDNIRGGVVASLRLLKFKEVEGFRKASFGWSGMGQDVDVAGSTSKSDGPLHQKVVSEKLSGLRQNGSYLGEGL